jgi:hypothetical protein
MTFTTQRLVNNRMLVRGTDILGVDGQCTLSTTQWDDINADKAFSQAEAEFNKAVEAFFAPLEAAKDQFEKAASRPDLDPATFVVLEEPVEGQPSKPGRMIKLSHDSVVLRLLEQGNSNRLVWVGDMLEVLEPQPAAPAPVTFEDPDAAIITADQIPG